MCLSLDENGVPVKEPLTIGNYLNVALIAILVASAAYSVVLILLGGYKIAFIKTKEEKLLGRKQIKRGVIIFLVAFAVWLLINLINEYFGVNTLCL